jgi:hypothetical protein
MHEQRMKAAEKLKRVAMWPPIEGKSEWQRYKQDTQAQGKKPLRRNVAEAQISYPCD